MATLTAYLHGSSCYTPADLHDMPAERLAASLSFWETKPFSSYIRVGTAELTVTLDSREACTASAVEALRNQQQTVRAQAEATAQCIEQQIAKLLAITCDGVLA